ncbi:hypothetical protein V5F32_08335 [Xanthobacter oligotrophicus]|jgi:hypothetical protein|uniref:Uncharacterized protein n=2 Tax=Xanthobacter TaxID=279 RepID=A0A6C1KSQ5_XANAU|nr:hypothetical protein [Xanthobacter autotrophicus]TLX41773.1 hypothetical protein FBQ73_16790 [Xanthobacter autotrophicus]
MNLKVISVAAAIGAIATPALPDECAGPKTKTNLCDIVSKAAASLAPKLPMQLSPSETMQGVRADGVKLSFDLIVNKTDKEYNEEKEKMKVDKKLLYNIYRARVIMSVCSDQTLNYFIGEGGQIERIYISSDGFRLDAFTVTACPKPGVSFNPDSPPSDSGRSPPPASR